MGGTYTIESACPAEFTGRFFLGHSGSSALAGSTRGTHTGNPLHSPSVPAQHSLQIHTKQTHSLRAHRRVLRVCREQRPLVVHEPEPADGVVDDDSRPGAGVREVPPDAQLPEDVVDCGDEAGGRVQELLEDVDDAGDVLRADAVRGYLQMWRVRISTRWIGMVGRTETSQP